MDHGGRHEAHAVTDNLGNAGRGLRSGPSWRNGVGILAELCGYVRAWRYGFGSSWGEGES